MSGREVVYPGPDDENQGTHFGHREHTLNFLGPLDVGAVQPRQETWEKYRRLTDAFLVDFLSCACVLICLVSNKDVCAHITSTATY